jgi:hypothetical protein
MFIKLHNAVMEIKLNKNENNLLLLLHIQKIFTYCAQKQSK